MAIAIHNGFNHKDNCIHYLKSRVEVERETAVELADKIKDEKTVVLEQRQKIVETVQEVNRQFDVIHKAVTEMAEGK